MRRSAIALGIVCLGLLAAPALADLLAGWSFDSLSIPSGTTGTDYGPIASDGAGEIFGGNAYGHHANSATTWSSPVGNGSAKSFSSNTWTPGDYYQFQTSTLGYEDILFGWDQTRSSNGPQTFDLEFSLDGINFSVVVDDYTVAYVTWSSVPPPKPESTFGPFAIPAAADNQPVVYFRLTSQVTPSHTAGTNRVDNILVYGTLIPEPAGLLLLAAGLWTLRRR